MEVPQKYLSRQAEITEELLIVLNRHLDDFMAGRVEYMQDLKSLAKEMCLLISRLL